MVLKVGVAARASSLSAVNWSAIAPLGLPPVGSTIAVPSFNGASLCSGMLITVVWSTTFHIMLCRATKWHSCRVGHLISASISDTAVLSVVLVFHKTCTAPWDFLQVCNVDLLMQIPYSAGVFYVWSDICCVGSLFDKLWAVIQVSAGEV